MPSGARPASRATILVVDDDAALAEMLQLVLKQEGFETAWCGRGDTALDMFRDARPDLVLLDVMLPGKDGVEICRDLRAESDVPVVMRTAKSDTPDVVAGLEAGADDDVAVYQAVGAHDGGAFQAVFQFADVAGPVVFHQDAQRAFLDFQGTAALLSGNAVQQEGR